MKNLNLIKINGHYYLELDEIFAKSINDGNYEYKSNNISLEIKIASTKITDEYWQRAAKDSKRELFMNTVRPLLKSQMGYEYSEIICEEKAKKLCQKFYEAEDNGEKYEGPYLL